MTWGLLDILFVILIIISAVRGAFRGMIQEIISIAALFISLLLAAVFYPQGSEWIQDRSSIGDQASLIAFIAIFLASFILFKLLQKGIVYLINETPLESMDKMLGFFFGILEGILLSFLLVYLLNFQNIVDLSSMTETSSLLPYLERFLPALDKPVDGIIKKLQERAI